MTVRRLHNTVMAHWPRLAWLARCLPGEPTVEVLHGAGLEDADDWLCEAVWDGDYEAGGFDETDIVSGSGVRLRNGQVIFVSAGSTVDRLQSVSRMGAAWISNSLPCLLESLGADPDPSYPGYYWDFRSIIKGLSRYKRTLETSAGPVELTYFDNLVWDGTSIRRTPKAAKLRRFDDFASYRSAMASSMQGMAANMAHKGRREPFSMLGTCSAGYDSPTVAVLAAEAGCEEVLSFDRGRGGLLPGAIGHVAGEADSGEAIAAVLGLRTVLVKRDAWEACRLPEPPFVASNAFGEEVHYKAAEAHLAGRVLLTGYHGDKLWAKKTSHVDGDIVRGDPSGLALTEYRLSAGFIHCPVPFWGARQIRDIVGISNAPEMKPWDIGGEYSRPICRRIVEEAGVARGSFGVSKRATSVVLHNRADFLTEESMERYLQWLRRHRRDWVVRRRVPPVLSPAVDRAVVAAVNVARQQAERRVKGPVDIVRTSLERRQRAASPPSSKAPRAANARQQVPRAGGIPTPGKRDVRASALRALEDLRVRSARLRLGPTSLRRFVFPWAVAEIRPSYSSSPYQPLERKDVDATNPPRASELATARKTPLPIRSSA